MSEVGHVVVVGGGVAGCAVAFSLSLAGVRVTIVEREGVGTQASGWSAGGLNPLHGVPEAILPLAMESYRLHLALEPELERLTGRELGARRIAMAFVAPDEAEIPRLQAMGEVFEAAGGFSARWLDAAEVRQLEPRLRPDLVGALLTHGNGVLDSHVLTVMLAEAAQHLGATLQAGAVTGIRHADRRVTGVERGETVIACDGVVVAMGPWSRAAERWLDWPLPIEPLKGEILRMAFDGAPLPCDVVGPNVSLCGRADGQIWLTSTHEHAGFDTTPTERAYRSLYDPAVRLMPALSEARLVKQTVCLRPIAPDDLPIVGRVPGWEGAYLATGGGMKGVLLAPAIGAAVADLIVSGQTSISIEPCAPERFSRATA